VNGKTDRACGPRVALGCRRGQEIYSKKLATDATIAGAGRCVGVGTRLKNIEDR